MSQITNRRLRDKNKIKLLDFLIDEYGITDFKETDKIDKIIRDIKINNLLSDE